MESAIQRQYLAYDLFDVFFFVIGRYNYKLVQGWRELAGQNTKMFADYKPGRHINRFFSKNVTL
jgi:hypothetical protein